MPRPRVLSGPDAVRIFEQFGFSVVGQKGSHIKMHRVLSDGSHQTLTIPNHRELDRGTANSLFKQGSRYVTASDLRPYFYHEK